MKTNLENQITNYEQPIKQLIGKSIVAINYYEIDYGEPCWNEATFHSLDFGLEIRTNDDETYYFIWGNEFTQYNLKFRKGNITTEFASNNTIKGYFKLNNPKWNKLINHSITGIESIWSYWTNSVSTSNRNYYPETIRLNFEHGKSIWISALEIQNNNINRMSDHLTVIFDIETLQKYKI